MVPENGLPGHHCDVAAYVSRLKTPGLGMDRIDSLFPETGSQFIKKMSPLLRTALLGNALPLMGTTCRNWATQIRFLRSP